MPIGLVLSGGTSLGAIQAGMLHALYEQRIAPDLVVATSVGAVNGAFIASRPPTVATADALADVWRMIHRDEVFPPHLVTGLLGFLGRRSALLPSRRWGRPHRRVASAPGHRLQRCVAERLAVGRVPTGLPGHSHW